MKKAIGTLPEKTPEEKQREMSMISMFLHLKREYASVLILRHIKHYTYKQISEELDIPISAVKTWLHRGRAYVVSVAEAMGAEIIDQ